MDSCFYEASILALNWISVVFCCCCCYFQLVRATRFFLRSFHSQSQVWENEMHIHLSRDHRICVHSFHYILLYETKFMNYRSIFKWILTRLMEDPCAVYGIYRQVAHAVAHYRKRFIYIKYTCFLLLQCTLFWIRTNAPSSSEYFSYIEYYDAIKECCWCCHKKLVFIQIVRSNHPTSLGSCHPCC